MSREPREVVLWSTGGLWVRAEITAAADLRISGQDLRQGAEYEYWMTVPHRDLPALALVLDVAPESILDGLMGKADALVRTGERTWLREHGLEPHFHSWGQPGWA